jgi:pilus assembly protein FimV
MQNTPSSLKLRTSVWAVASCLALSSVPLAVQAAGLGKITVSSALGQPLRAEVELSATREELSGMKAQLASQDAFRLAGLDYVNTLSGIRFAIDKRANGQSVIKLSSDKPIIDPFVDMLLEINWATGRLVREYTFLLDPPEMAGRAAVVDAPATFTYTEQVRPSAELLAKPPRTREETRQPSRDAEGYQVRRGDTLAKIASETTPDGVSLEQMLVGLFRSNKDAFDGNMNRLKAGKILSLPDRAAVEAVSQGEAKKIVFAQAADWNAYRRNLAGIAAQAALGSEEGGKRESGGKVATKVDDKAAPALEPRDQVKVSKATADALKRSEEDLIAREKALKEAGERVSNLERNVTDLQKLVELKNQSLALLQKQMTAKPAVDPVKPEPVVKPPVEVKKPEAEVKPPVELKPPLPVVEVKKPEAEIKPVTAVPVEPTPPPVEKPVEVKPADPLPPKAEEIPVLPEPKVEAKPVEPPTPKPEVIAPPPPEEPDFVEELIDSPMVLAGGGGILALLAAYLIAKRRRKAKDEIPPAVRSALSARSSLTGRSTLAPQSGGSAPSSVFRSTGGHSIDTSYAPPPSDFSQAGPGTIDADEVDPVAEADVYMAYGRDAQAEEILLEARNKDPKRLAIPLKLLEIYANRKNVKQFETLAADFYSETGGVGPEWEKAAAMGLKLDPSNPLFGGKVQVSAPVATEPPSLASLDFDIAQSPASEVRAKEPQLTPEPLAAIPVMAVEEITPTPPPKPKGEITVVLPQDDLDAAPLDFDLGETPTPELPKAKPEVARQAEPEPEPLDLATAALDFNLPEDAPAATATPLPEPTKPSSPTAPSNSPAEPDLDFDLEFDVKMTDSAVLGQPMQSPSFDMTSISLDLDDLAMGGGSKSDQDLGEPLSDDEIAHFESAIGPSEAEAAPVAPSIPDFAEDLSSNEEVATKLDLASAYEEMGDLEGVRELLQEVLREGNTAQREKAQITLARIGE